MKEYTRLYIGGRQILPYVEAFKVDNVFNKKAPIYKTNKKRFRNKKSPEKSGLFFFFRELANKSSRCR